MTENNNQLRRILVNGEHLSFTTDRPPRRGEKFHPKSLEEARAILKPQLEQVQKDLAAIPPELRGERVVIEAEVWANYLANSWFPKRLVRLLDLRPLGSRVVRDGVKITKVAGETTALSKSYLLSADPTGVAQMLALLDGKASDAALNKAAEELCQFSEIKLADAYQREADGAGLAVEAYEAVLHPDPDRSTILRRVQASDTTLKKFEALVGSVDGRIVGEIDQVDGLTFVALELPTHAVSTVARFNPLRSLSPMPKMDLATQTADVEASGKASAPEAAAATLPKVLIFDGGVDSSGAIFRDVVQSVDLTGKGIVPKFALHGSAVTAAVLYGDVGTRGSLGAPAAQVTHYQVFPCPVPQHSSEYPWILKQIRETVESTDAKIVNLSLGPKAPVDDGEPHRWTAVLDKLAFERGILFVNAAGNNGASPIEGFDRVQVPADMVNGLSVGASDAPATAETWDAAHYSARGPGRPGGRIQPSVMSFGGTPRDSFGRVRPDGAVHHDDHGTSYATPLVTHEMARLSHELGGRADAPTLRALAVHFAQRDAEHDQTRVGHGRLRGDIVNLLTCEPYEATVIYHGILGRTEVRAFALPFPAAFAGGDIELSWTVAYSTATDATEAGEYTNAGLEAFFRPHKDKRTMSFEGADGSHHKSVNIHTDRNEIAHLISAGWSLPNTAATRSPKITRRFEGDQRELGKWETIWHSKDSIRASSMHEPRIDINHLSREGGRITRDTDDIEFSLVVTMRSRARKPLYDLVRNEFGALVPLPLVAEATAPVVAQNLA